MSTTGKIITKAGTMKFELYDKETPNTAKNFTELSRKGFYKNLKFHRVLPEFVVQGGCPQGTGSGGPGYRIACETTGDKQHHEKGVLSMAHAGKDTGGSQFFIVKGRPRTSHLDRNHTCFGMVTDGLDLIDSIQQGDTFEITIDD
jgi:peptidyl-prolyl cis-trans isomerase B (cyclophilin B)|tara:strand:+ start:9372 stop:9806 length:435 start_codon:yes stop_codon:yes gene_type:complete